MRLIWKRCLSFLIYIPKCKHSIRTYASCVQITAVCAQFFCWCLFGACSHEQTRQQPDAPSWSYVYKVTGGKLYAIATTYSIVHFCLFSNSIYKKRNSMNCFEDVYANSLFLRWFSFFLSDYLLIIFYILLIQNCEIVNPFLTSLHKHL